MNAHRIRDKSLFQWIEYSVMISFLLLYRLPAAFNLQDNIPVRLLCLAPIIFVILRRLVVIITTKESVRLVANKYYPIYILYLLLMTAAFIRTILNESVGIAEALGSFVLFFTAQGFIFILASQSEMQSDTLKKGIYLSLLFYVVANLLMAIFNLTTLTDSILNQRTSTLASYMGLKIYRIAFPMATGNNSYAIIAGVLLIGSFFVLREKKFGPLLRISGLLGILVSLFTLLSTDARAAFFFAILTIGCSFIPFPFSRILRTLPVVSVAFPLVLLLLLRVLPTSIFQFVSRGLLDASTLSNRLLIWTAGLQTLALSPEHWLFGYGYRGQIVSGAMEKYLYIFSSFTDTTSISLHNSFFQSLFEIGLVGVVLLVLNLLVLFMILDRQRRSSISPWTNMLYFTLIYFSLISSTESVLSFDHQEAYILFIFIATITIFSGLSKNKEHLGDA